MTVTINGIGPGIDGEYLSVERECDYSRAGEVRSLTLKLERIPGFGYFQDAVEITFKSKGGEASCTTLDKIAQDGINPIRQATSGDSESRSVEAELKSEIDRLRNELANATGVDSSARHFKLLAGAKERDLDSMRAELKRAYQTIERLTEFKDHWDVRSE